MSYSRRDWIRSAALGIAGVLVTRRAFGTGLSAAPIAITVYKSPSCGCCKDWVKHLSANGFAPVVHDLDALDALADIKASMGVPRHLESCHTAVVSRYAVEGHVPADLIKRLLTQHPANIAGLSVPGMVAGSPGMETGAKQPYDVIAFARNGKTSVYAHR
jgi:hypothetical protein